MASRSVQSRWPQRLSTCCALAIVSALQLDSLCCVWDCCGSMDVGMIGQVEISQSSWTNVPYLIKAGATNLA